MSDDHSHAAPGPMTREEFKAVVREAIREEFELIGIDSSDATARSEVRKDMETVRRMREVWDGAARKIGNTVLALMFAGAVALVALGVSIQAKGLK